MHSAPDLPPALFRRFPALADAIPWLPLSCCPTPIEPLRLPGVEGEVWVKRDDLSGEAYGGNKVRKLEFLLAEAQRQGAERLITAGAAGSHHALATTVYGRSLGLAVSLVLFPQSRTEHVREVLLLDQALGAELRWVPRMEMIPPGLWAARLAHRDERTAVIPPGGSDPTGTLGYVSAALELAEQVDAGEAPAPQVAHVATGTMGTTVGLAIGLVLAGLPTRVNAYRITGKLVTNEWGLRGLIRRTSALLRTGGVPVPPEAEVRRRIELHHEQLGEGYGRPTAACEQAAERFAQAGLKLDPTYTAKAAAGLLVAVEAKPQRTHLFWQTLSGSEPPCTPAKIADLPEPFRRYLDGR